MTIPRFTSLFCAIMGIASIAYSQTTVEEFKSHSWDKSHSGTALDLTQYKQTFFDDFNALTVTADGGKGPWYAPGHSTFGAGKFQPPGPNGPFTVKDGNLTLKAEKVNERWQAACMQTVDNKGRGFAQQYGYFEMRAKFPPGRGGWPAFWLLSQNGYLDKTATRTEIDIVEWYSGDPKGHHASVHLWPAQQKPENYPLAKHAGRSNYYNLAKVNPPVLVNGQLEGFHTYGAEVTPEWVIIYFDRSEVARFEMMPEWKTPLYMVVDLAIFQKEAKVAESPKEMVVDYVSAYQRK